LTGAPVLQALLDAEGDPSGLPSEVVAAIRRLEAQASQRDEGNALDPDAILLRLEAGYVDREIQTNNRMLQDPKILADPLLSERLMTQQHELLIRKRGLAQRRRTRNTA
jgi:DNA primase